MNNPVDAQAVKAYLLDLQERIVGAVEEIDGKAFDTDRWEKGPDEALGGSGITRVLEDGAVFERAAVAFSHVSGPSLPAAASAKRPELAGRGFEAMGVSLVFHPHNPFVPTVHMNVRLFLARAAGQEDVWWIGGGMDLTPYYGFEEDAVHFHATCRDALDVHDKTLYPRFKAWCDEYFYLKHRAEARGVGGIFFDDFQEGGFTSAFALQRSVGDHFLRAYLPIVGRRASLPYADRHRDWQACRRGRYVEFNLVYDRGTLFGLQSGGRAESILMSMPPLVRWRYRHEPAADSLEAELLTRFLPKRNWLT